MEDLFNKVITIINRYYDTENKVSKYKVSYVYGFWSSNDGISISGTQLTKADGLSAKILINDSRNEVYQSPESFKKSQDTWTLQPDDYLVKGKVTDFTSVTDLLENYQDVIKISDISIKDYGPDDLQHFAITGA